MRLRRIARPLARKGLSVIAAFLLNELPNFSWDLERRVTPVEIAADRNRSIVVSNPKNADRGRRGDDDVLVSDSPKRRCEVDDRG